MALLAAALSGFAMALVAPALQRAVPRLAGWLFPLLPASLFVFFAAQLPAVLEGETPGVSLRWWSGMGVELSLRLDGLSLLFALLITGIGALVLFYASDYVHPKSELGQFQAFTLAFMASMLGVVLAEDLIALFVFWELTSVASFFLIGFHHERPEARSSALQALMVTSAGGLMLLAGILLLQQVGGTFSLSALLGRGAQVAESPLHPAIVLLILAGAFIKSAQVPFSWWLPGAMTAPTPATAYLHAATMVKAGVYLLARLSPLLAQGPLWQGALQAVGGVTFLVGAVRAFRETHLKRVLAQSTLSALGVMVFFLGGATQAAAMAAIAYVLAHALYKGALFLVAGALAHQTGTSDIGRLSGLWRAMPLTAAAGALGALSMSGIPPSFGFLGKELLLETAVHQSAAASLLIVVGSALTLAIAVRAALRPFVGPSKEPAAGEATVRVWLPPLMLSGAGVVIGVFPQLTWPLLQRAAAAVTGAPVTVPLEPLQLGWPLALSAIAIVAGAGAYLARSWLARVPTGLGESRLYIAGLATLDRVATWQTAVLQSGYLRYYVLIVLACVVGVVGLGVVSGTAPIPIPSPAEAHLYEAALTVIIVAAALNAVRSRSRLSAIASMGAVGYGVGLVFLLFGAPDLAMTQFVVETLTVILFVFAFYYLPRFGVLSPPASRLRDAVISLAVGGVVAALILGANAVLWGEKISQYFLETSYLEGHGRNVVNVILTDFRALDTLGEITVLAVAGTGVFALLKLRPGAGVSR